MVFDASYEQHLHLRPGWEPAQQHDQLRNRRTPKVIEAILDGRKPNGFSQTKLTGAIPADWEEQRRKWGFHA